MKKENIYIDLSKCSTDEQKHIFSLLPEPINEEDYMIFDSFYNLHSDNERWYCGSSWVSIAKTELTYPEFIKLFEGAETIKSDNTETLANALHQIEKLEADKGELLEALEKCNNELHFYSGHTDFVKEIESLIQKHKQ